MELKDGTDSQRRLNVSADIVDLRDRYYDPALTALRQTIRPAPHELNIANQGSSGACTGFALAAVVDRQIKRILLEAARTDPSAPSVDDAFEPVSAWMLYEMARLHDDLPNAKAAGSTVRGALKGFYHNGVCPYALAQFDETSTESFFLTRDRAEAARNVSLGAYYRLNHEINDYHTAISEAGAVLVSAKLHPGWKRPRRGRIKLSSRFEGRHAFAIVGYDRDGFLIQNSWGEDWSHFGDLKGVAHWSYEDWFENVEDAWVLRLGISSPQAFKVKFARNHKDFRKAGKTSSAIRPRRHDIADHFLHFDDGDLVRHGRYAQRPEDISEIKLRIQAFAEASQEGSAHLLFVAHGAMQNRDGIAARAHAWRDTFLRNNIYPIHLMWETGLNNDVVDVIRDLLFKTKKQMNEGDALIDARLEDLARPLGRKLWRDLQVTARLGTSPDTEAGGAILDIMHMANGLKVHFLSQSAGVFLFSRALQLARRAGIRLETASMMAPACSTRHYNVAIKPYLETCVGRLIQYGLVTKREKEDRLDVYGRSLLYLVAASLEKGERSADSDHLKPVGILGLEEDFKDCEPHDCHQAFWAGRDRSATDSKEHRGFDRDMQTMNHLVETITGTRPRGKLAFSSEGLGGY